MWGPGSWNRPTVWDLWSPWKTRILASSSTSTASRNFSPACRVSSTATSPYPRDCAAPKYARSARRRRRLRLPPRPRRSKTDSPLQRHRHPFAGRRHDGRPERRLFLNRVEEVPHLAALVHDVVGEEQAPLVEPRIDQ